MTLAMTRPWKHPDSGYYWFRKRIPDDLREAIGKREERFSLGTRDPDDAKRLHTIKLAEVEERWSNLRAGQRPLSPDDIAQLASEIGDQLRRQLEDIGLSRADTLSLGHIWGNWSHLGDIGKCAIM